MIPRRLDVEDFLSFRGASGADFPDGLTVIRAEYAGEPLRSNRAGKSALAVDALTFLLYGRVRDVPLERVVHRGAARARVRGLVEFPDRTLEVVRTVTARGEHAVELDGRAVGVRDAATALEAATGLTYDEFVSTQCFLQGEVEQFLRLEKGEQRALLLRWAGETGWTPREARAREHLRAREVTFEEARVAALRAETAATELPGATERLAAAVEAARAADAAVQEALGAERAWAETVAAAATGTDPGARLAQARNARETLSRTLAEFDAVRARADALDNFLIDASARLGDRTRARPARDAARDAYRAAEREEREARTALETRAREQTGRCPVLGEPCDRVAPGVGLTALKREQPTRAAETRARKADWDTAETAVRGAERAVEEDDRAAAERRSFEARLQGVDRAALRRQVTEAGLLEKAAELAVKRAGVPADGAAAANLAAWTLSRTELETAAADAHAARGAAAARVEALRTAAEGLPGAGRARDAAAEARAVAQYTVYLFSAHGVPGRALAAAFDAAGGEVNALLAALRLPVELDLRPDRELKDWEPLCLACGTAFPKGARSPVCAGCETPREKRRKDELTFLLREGGGEGDFRLDSGAGRTLIAFALRVALARLRARRRGALPAWLVLDEVGGPFDAAAQAAFATVLRTTLPAWGFRSLWLIDHGGLQDAGDRTVTVLRDGDGARVLP